MRLEFILKRENVSFSEKQKLDIEHHINDQSNWAGLKQDFVSIRFISINHNSFLVEVEDRGIEWRKHLVRKLIKLAALDNLCVPATNNTGRMLFDFK